MIHSIYPRSHLHADVPTTETSTSGGKFHANLSEEIPQKKVPCIPERAPASAHLFAPVFTSPRFYEKSSFRYRAFEKTSLPRAADRVDFAWGVIPSPTLIPDSIARSADKSAGFTQQESPGSLN